MSKFIKNMKPKLMLGAFLGVASATAMDGAREPQDKADAHMRRAYAALDIVSARKEEAACIEKREPFRLFYCNSIRLYFSITNRADLFREFESSEDAQLLKVAERELTQALDLGDFYAASVLNSLLKNIEETRDIRKEALLKSIMNKKQKGIKVGLLMDTVNLMAIEGISLKTMAGIQRVEEINLDQTIASYGYLASNLDNPDSQNAFDALMRLQENPGAWLHLADACFSRKLPEDGINWMEKIVTHGGIKDLKILNILENNFQNNTFSIDFRLRAARLAYEYVQKNGRGTETLFSSTIDYYKILKEAKSLGQNVEGLIFEVCAVLERIAEESKNPELLFQWALTQEEAVKEGDDRSAIFDMYRKAAAAKSYKAVEHLATSPFLLETWGIGEAVSFLIQYQQEQSLLNLYENEKTTNPAYLVILSLLLENKTDRHDKELGTKVTGFLKEYENSYVPAIDFNIWKLTKDLGIHSRFVKDASDLIQNAFYYYCHDSVFIPTDAYHQAGYKLTGKSDANKFMEMQKAIKDGMQKQITELSEKKNALIHTLSAQDLFDLAQENDVINRGCEAIFEFDHSRPPSYYENFVLMLEKSAEKGFAPAVTQLVDLYTNGYLRKKPTVCYLPSHLQAKETCIGQSAEKAAFYQGIQAILTDTTLGVIEQADLLKKAFEPK